MVVVRFARRKQCACDFLAYSNLHVMLVIGFPFSFRLFRSHSLSQWTFSLFLSYFFFSFLWARPNHNPSSSGQSRYISHRRFLFSVFSQIEQEQNVRIAALIVLCKLGGSSFSLHMHLCIFPLPIMFLVYAVSSSTACIL
jgi:hypothetical protein